jgi:C4-dicarboxylate transporter DctM subunit
LSGINLATNEFNCEGGEGVSPIETGIIGIAVLFLLFALGMPIAFSMAFVGFIGFVYLVSPGAALNILARDYFDQLSSYNLSTIVTFVLMGTLAFGSGITGRLYKTAYTWVGQLRGGLTMASVLACAFFAAICGSTSATAATVGKIALPEMKKYGYDDTLATGAIAAGGTLGILIPPSALFIVYGILTEQSIGKLFIAGVLPGVLLTILFMITVAIWVMLKPDLAPPGPRSTWGQKFKAFAGIIEVIVLFGLTIGGLFVGWFTPTQAGGIGAAGALLIGLVRMEISWKKYIAATKEALITSCMILFIITGATVFGHFMAVSKVPLELAAIVQQYSVSPVITLVVICIIYIIGGCFMDGLALVVLTIPIIFPVVVAAGIDPIWFGVIITLLTEAAVITPPVGVNVFVIHGIAKDVPLEQIFKGIFPFLGALIICLAILIAFPQISTFLPSFTTY